MLHLEYRRNNVKLTGPPGELMLFYVLWKERAQRGWLELLTGNADREEPFGEIENELKGKMASILKSASLYLDRYVNGEDCITGTLQRFRRFVTVCVVDPVVITDPPVSPLSQYPPSSEDIT